MLKPVQDPRHGDYQANCAMSLAKVLGKKPRDYIGRAYAGMQQQQTFDAHGGRIDHQKGERPQLRRIMPCCHDAVFSR